MDFRVDTIVEPLLGIYPDYSQEGRVLVDRVVPASSAVAAGLQPGDQLLRVGVVDVEGEDWAPEFRRIYADSVGAEFSIDVLRDGQVVTGHANIQTRTRVEYRIEPLVEATETQLRIRRGVVTGTTR